VTKTNRSTLRLFGCYYLVPNFDFFINWVGLPKVGLPKTSKQSLAQFTPSISGKTRGDGEKWLWYLDSASLNYPGTDTLVLVIELAEICVMIQPNFITFTCSVGWSDILFSNIRYYSYMVSYFENSCPINNLRLCLISGCFRNVLGTFYKGVFKNRS
jgi:hypothetical protein